ncbi:VOC family protein [Leptospira langatensis]|uniref:VOC family protein n=1 Tax=Leptospira langatensis TaxID=2484983 RepID=A0A5F1ZUK3_9LEPT|nr:VOC family protein [Leptospira langatensis]TGK01410.1 VOC family protein [Leptospira langatensis]TGL42140.1 VOC family protein [Leptospira langatensis]
MARVTGIGGIFFKAKDPVALREWYKRHLGVPVNDWGGAVFEWADEAGNAFKGSTAWSIFGPDSEKLGNSSYQINYRVDNLTELLDSLRKDGFKVPDKGEDSEYGKFGWVIDPEGNKVELWEPPAGE